MSLSAEERRNRGCLRCGTCCRKGGPSLHIEDRHLVETGKIPLSALVTIRKGEWVFDGLKGAVRRTEREFVRIRGKDNVGWTCIYWDEVGHACQIYPDRPIECRALACWDTSAIEAIYEHPRLTRADILKGAPPQWMELIDAHEEQCDIDRLMGWLGWERTDGDSRVSVIEMLAFDEHMRRLTVERSRVDPAILPFLFGRLLREMVPLLRRLVQSNR